MKISTAEHLQRLISIVSWINAEDGPTVAEVCTRFTIDRDELVNQLEMASLVGGDSDEYGDMPIEVYFDEDRVFVHLTAFKRPLRLTPEQGLALVASGAGLLRAGSPDPDGPLARALAKVAALIGLDAGEVVEVDLGGGDAATLDLLRRAVVQHTPVDIAYWSAGRDDHTQRTIEPWRVFNEAGAWYVQAHCRTAAAPRIFRVDRIRTAVAVDGDPFVPPSKLPAAVAYEAGAADPRITLDLAPDARWVATMYPIDQSEDLPDARVRVTMPAGAPAFMARLLLRLGPDATVVAGEDRSGGRASAAETAARILARYGTN